MKPVLSIATDDQLEAVDPQSVNLARICLRSMVSHDPDLESVVETAKQVCDL